MDARAKIWGCMYSKLYRYVIKCIGAAKNESDIIEYNFEGRHWTDTKAGAKKAFLEIIVGRTYMANLKAVVSWLAVHGSPPGAGADFKEVRVGRKTKIYMYINTATYKTELKILRDELGFSLDETGHIAYSGHVAR